MNIIGTMNHLAVLPAKQTAADEWWYGLSIKDQELLSFTSTFNAGLAWDKGFEEWWDIYHKRNYPMGTKSGFLTQQFAWIWQSIHEFKQKQAKGEV